MNTLLPKPPTSNLYAFLAILGLTLALASYVYADHSESVARQKVIEFSNFSSQSIFEASNLAIGFEKLSDEEKQKIRNKLDLDRTKFGALASEMMVYSRKFDEAKIIKAIGGIAGGVISLVGFFLWYWRIQRAKDKIFDIQTREPRVVFKRPT